MKEIKEEHKREIVELNTFYEAQDGTRFTDEEQCLLYEDSALGVVRGKLAQLFVGEKKDAWELMGGYEEHTVCGIALTKQEDVDTVLQLLYLEHPYYLNDTYTKRREEIESIVNTAYKEKDIILLGINCDDKYYFINSRQNIIKNLMNFTEAQKK